MTKPTPGAMRTTKGPWKIEADFFIRAKEDGRAICEVNQEFRHYGMPARSDIEQVDMANARLIAASPAMIEALQALMDEYKQRMDGDYPGENLHQFQSAYKMARAAIAAATGEGKIG